MLSVHVYSMCIKWDWVYKIYLHKSQYLPNRVMIRVTSKSVPSTSQDRVFLLNFISCFDRCLTDWCLGRIIDWDSATGSFIYFMPCQSVLRFLLIPHNLTWSHWVDSFIQKDQQQIGLHNYKFKKNIYSSQPETFQSFQNGINKKEWYFGKYKHKE